MISKQRRFSTNLVIFYLDSGNVVSQGLNKQDLNKLVKIWARCTNSDTDLCSWMWDEPKLSVSKSCKHGWLADSRWLFQPCGRLCHNKTSTWFHSAFMPRPNNHQRPFQNDLARNSWESSLLGFPRKLGVQNNKEEDLQGFWSTEIKSRHLKSKRGRSLLGHWEYGKTWWRCYRPFHFSMQFHPGGIFPNQNRINFLPSNHHTRLFSKLEPIVRKLRQDQIKSGVQELVSKGVILSLQACQFYFYI